jgi:hypothetical protein
MTGINQLREVAKVKRNNVVYVDFKRMVKVQDFNCEALASAQHEDKLLTCLENLLEIIDQKDGIMGNEYDVEQAKKIARDARHANNYQYENDRSEQLILDTDIPMFNDCA